MQCNNKIARLEMMNIHIQKICQISESDMICEILEERREVGIDLLLFIFMEEQSHGKEGYKKSVSENE